LSLLSSVSLLSIQNEELHFIIFYYILLSEEFQQDILFFHISLIDSLLFVAYDK